MHLHNVSRHIKIFYISNEKLRNILKQATKLMDQPDENNISVEVKSNNDIDTLKNKVETIEKQIKRQNETINKVTETNINLLEKLDKLIKNGLVYIDTHKHTINYLLNLRLQKLKLLQVIHNNDLFR